MTDDPAVMEMAEHLVGRIIEKFEVRYGVELCQLERDCLSRDFQVEVDEVVDFAYGCGWQAGDLFREECGLEAAAREANALLEAVQRHSNGKAA